MTFVVDPSVPEVIEGSPPLSLLVDYDGTISLTDVTEILLAEHVAGAVWEDAEVDYDAGRMGSRRLMSWEVSLIDADPAVLRSTAAAQPHDPGFVPLVRRAQSAGIPIEIVSDGYGFFIQPALEALGVGELPIVTARTTFRVDALRSSSRTATPPATCAGRASAGGCWRIALQAGGSCMSATARATAMPRATATSCSRNAHWSGSAWKRAGRSTAGRRSTRSMRWLVHTLDAWRADPSTLAPSPVDAAPPRGYFCGPEVWGEGLEDPPAGSWPPPR